MKSPCVEVNKGIAAGQNPFPACHDDTKILGSDSIATDTLGLHGSDHCENVESKVDEAIHVLPSKDGEVADNSYDLIYHMQVESKDEEDPEKLVDEPTSKDMMNAEDEKQQPTPPISHPDVGQLRPPFPPPAYNGYSHAYPPPYWGYYPGFYPPPYFIPPSESNKFSAPIGAPPYYPPPIPPYPLNSSYGSVAHLSSDHDQSQHFPPHGAYPYYPLYHPPASQKPGLRPPMSPLMQQPLFHSPGPSPYQQSYPPPSSASPFPPPYFPTPIDFGKQDSKSKPRKLNPIPPVREKENTRQVMKSFPNRNEQFRISELKGKAIAKTENEDIRESAENGVGNEPRSMDYDEDDVEYNGSGELHKSNSSVATASSTADSVAINPSMLATYVKPRLPTNEEELHRRFRKNAQARARAEARKARVELILAKHSEIRTEDEKQFLNDYERGRSRKNNRSRSRATENKEHIDAILRKPLKQRTKIEVQYLEQYLLRKERKNEGDRLRRERLKMLGLDSKKPLKDGNSKGRPTVTARGPLPPELLARAGANKTDSRSFTAYAPSSPRSESGPTYGMYPPPGYPPYGFPPPPYWPDQLAGFPPPPAEAESGGNDLSREPRYHTTFSVYPTDRGNIETSWSTPPRISARRREKIVTNDIDDADRMDTSKTPKVKKNIGRQSPKSCDEKAPIVTV